MKAHAHLLQTAVVGTKPQGQVNAKEADAKLQEEVKQVEAKPKPDNVQGKANSAEQVQVETKLDNVQGKANSPEQVQVEMEPDNVQGKANNAEEVHKEVAKPGIAQAEVVEVPGIVQGEVVEVPGIVQGEVVEVPGIAQGEQDNAKEVEATQGEGSSMEVEAKLDNTQGMVSAKEVEAMDTKQGKVNTTEVEAMDTKQGKVIATEVEATKAGMCSCKWSWRNPTQRAQTKQQGWPGLSRRSPCCA